MAHDRMNNDDLDRNMGRAGQEDEFGGQQGRQTPGRNPQDQQTGQKGAGQKNDQNLGNEDDDEFGSGGSTGQGGRNPNQGQNR